MSGKKKKPKFDNAKFKSDCKSDVNHVRELNAFLNHCKDKMAFSLSS